MAQSEVAATGVAVRAVVDQVKAVPSRSEAIRAALTQRVSRLRAERLEALAGLEGKVASDAGDDLVDLGAKTFAREQEYALVAAIESRILQVERALGRLAEGRYGLCEDCSREIPIARLTAFPAVTQCVACKRAEERR